MKTLKKQISIFLMLIYSLSIFSITFIQSTSLSLENKTNKKFFSKKILMKNKNLQVYEIIWKQLFIGERGESCKKDKSKIQKKITLESSLESQNKRKSDFSFVEKWGYGPIAYFFDFIEPVILGDVLNDFRNIFDSIKKFKPYNTEKDLNEELQILQKLKKNKKFNFSVFRNSVNKIQVKNALEKWKWQKNFSSEKFEEAFISKFDLNKDTRLNARELLLGSIYSNRKILGKGFCKNCFEDSIKKIDAIFYFINCKNEKFIDAEKIWNSLKQLKRSTQEFNIYKIQEKGIKSVNDFVLKNNKILSGKLTKEEFRNGILLGIWDRHTSYMKILNDDSRSLKYLRWNKRDKKNKNSNLLNNNKKRNHT